ncbi:MAG: DUF1778 domain-containing protein [Verrucomicrobia bacterium]|nr:DUF1778 domain-containing protein [Verrucomicrobiota bacterium]
MSVTITVKTKAEQKRRLGKAARKAGKSLSSYLLESALERDLLSNEQKKSSGKRPDYHAQAVSAHGDRYLALRLVDALER